MSVIKKSAVISNCGDYRYELRRRWTARASKRFTVAFIGLNPSTADASNDDPTIRRCMGYAQSWQFKQLVVVNLFAWRATLPSDLKNAPDPIGPLNDEYINEAVKKSGLIVACWGEHGQFLNRADTIRPQYKSRLHYLKCNRSGEPAHPLYLPASLTPQKFKV